jgi:hypothetical protein
MTLLTELHRGRFWPRCRRSGRQPASTTCSTSRARDELALLPDCAGEPDERGRARRARAVCRRPTWPRAQRASSSSSRDDGRGLDGGTRRSTAASAGFARNAGAHVGGERRDPRAGRSGVRGACREGRRAGKNGVGCCPSRSSPWNPRCGRPRRSSGSGLRKVLMPSPPPCRGRGAGRRRMRSSARRGGRRPGDPRRLDCRSLTGIQAARSRTERSPKLRS